MPSKPKTILAAFDRGQMPTIACVNAATVPLGIDFAKLVAVMQRFVNEHFAPVWGTPCNLVAVNGTKPPANAWVILFTDDADVAGALGYHDMAKNGMPVSYVFVKTSIADGESVSVTATHELAEMLIDPAVQLWALDAKGRLFGYETADAVERTTFKIDGVDVTNFLYPAAFESFRKAKSTKFDHLNLTTKPFQILKGGYSVVMVNGRVSQVFGSTAAKRAMEKQDRRLHRGHWRIENSK